MKSILIIEDDTEIRNSLKEVLELEGYTVFLVNNGRDALNFLNTQTPYPDIILLDMMMPVMSGYEFRNLQLADEKLSRIPTAILSAEGNLDVKVQELDVEYILKKPIDLDHLISTIEQMT